MNDQEQLRNWVKAVLGLKIVRDGLLPFMDQECHDLYLRNETYTQKVCKFTSFACTQCSVKKLRPDHSENKCPTKGKHGQIQCGCQPSANKQTCPNGGSCGVLYDLILNQHVKTAPRWDNSDCSKWYKNGWEQMKCYIDIPGYNEKNNISQADITAFVHICQNNKTLKNKFRTEIDKLIQVRTDRNEIFHSGDMDITDDKLKEYLTHMRDVLQIAVFNKLPDIQTYLDKLTKLETDTSSGEDTTQEIEARKDALKALIEESKALQEQNMKIYEGATDINHQLAQLAVLQDNHMKCITEHLKSIKCHMKIVKEEHNKSAESLLQHSNDLKCITSAIEQHTTRLKDLQQEFVQQTEIIRGLQTVTMGIERTVTKNYRMISEIQSEIHTMLLIVKELHKHYEATSTIEGKFVAEMNGISNKVELTHEAVQRLRSILTKSGPDASDTTEQCLVAVKGELEEEGIILKDVQDGSVEMSFQCSIPTWIKVCKRCMDGSMATIFGPLQDHLRIKHGVDNLQITVDMYETDFVKSVEAIVKQLHPKLIAMLPNFAKSKCYGDPTQMKLDDVLRVVLEHAKSREPSFQITVAGKVEDSHAVSEKTDVSDTERSPSENDDTDVFDELQSATGEITSCEQDVSVTGTFEGEHTEGLQSATAETLQTGKDAFLYDANEFEKLTSEQEKEKDTKVKVGAGSAYFLCPRAAELTVNAQKDKQKESDATNQPKGWIERCGARLDSILEMTDGKSKTIIEGFCRMPLVFILFAWATLGPTSDYRLLEIPCFLCRYFGILVWIKHVQTGFQTMLPLYVEAVLCCTSTWLGQAIYWTLQSQNEAACFLDELGIAFSDTYPNRKITFISALVVRSLFVHRFVNKQTHAFWVNITLTIITMLSISTKWYLFMQLDYWSMQCFYCAFIIGRWEVRSKTEINRLKALRKASDIKMRPTTDETLWLVYFEKIRTFLILITMQRVYKLSWKAVSYFSNQCIIFFIFQTSIVALVATQPGFTYDIERNIYCYAVLCCYNMISGFGLATLVAKILEKIVCLLARFVFQSSNPNTNFIRINVVITIMILYIDSNLFLLDVNTRKNVLLTILLMALSQVMLLVVDSVELEILSIINEGARNKLFKLFYVLISTAFILTTYLYISSHIAMMSGVGGWTFLFLSKNVVVLAKVFFLFLKTVILFSSRFPSFFQEHLDNLFLNMKAISNITCLVCMWLHLYTRLFAPNMRSFFLIRLLILVIDIVFNTSIACYAEWRNYLVRNQLQGFIMALPEVQELDENEECSVCFTPREVGKQLPCGHAFHYDCLKRWFRVRTVCPLCNIAVQFPEIDDIIGNAMRTFINGNQ